MEQPLPGEAGNEAAPRSGSFLPTEWALTEGTPAHQMDVEASFVAFP